MLLIVLFAPSFLQASFDIVVKVKKCNQTIQHEQLISFEGHRCCRTVVFDDGLQIKMDPRVVHKNQVSINFELSRVNSDEYFFTSNSFVICEPDKVAAAFFSGTKERVDSELSFVLIPKKD